MEEMSQAIHAVTSPVVRVWVNWMMLVFACSIVFAWKYAPARVVLAVFGITLLLSLLIYRLTNEPHLLGLGHILLWAPLAWYLITRVIKNERFNAVTPYGTWVLLLVFTIFISLLFDIRDVGLVAAGRK